MKRTDALRWIRHYLAAGNNAAATRVYLTHRISRDTFKRLAHEVNQQNHSRGNQRHLATHP